MGIYSCAVAALAEHAGPPGPDIFLAPVIEAAKGLIVSTDLRTRIEAAVGTLA